MASCNPIREQIITDFLAIACEERKWKSDDAITAWLHRAHIATLFDDEKVGNIPLSTGSVAEFSIQPMLSCIGDIDIMYHSGAHLAIPKGSRPPTELPAEFGSCVVVCKIVDSEYPGYVYLEQSHVLRECINGKYVEEQHQGEYLSYSVVDDDMHGPAYVSIYPHRVFPINVFCLAGSHVPVEYVRCIRCLLWPPQAADWPTRERNNSWPDSAAVDRVVSEGCDVVAVAHRQCRQDEWMSHRQWRLSFSRAEITLINTWSTLRQTVYHVLRVFVKTERLTESADNSGSSTLSNYHIKTLMLWASELKSSSWWCNNLNTVRICANLLYTLGGWIANPSCKHYFIKNCNLFDCLDKTQYAEETANRLKSVNRETFCEWFVNTYMHKCSRICPESISRLFEDVSTSAKLQDAAFAVVHWRRDKSVIRSWFYFRDLQFGVAYVLSEKSVHLQSWSCLFGQLAHSYNHQDLCFYFAAIAFLNITFKAKQDSLNDEMLDVILNIVSNEWFSDADRCINARHESVLSLEIGAIVVSLTDAANGSSDTKELIAIELSKAYLYRALSLSLRDTHNASIHDGANVYLAVLYYTTGQYQKAMDHCTAVTRSHNHTQRCVGVRGEYLPKIDDDVDNILGLAMFYQYIRKAALNHEQQTQKHVNVLTTQLFAYYLHIRCLLATQCHQVTEMSLTDEIRRYRNCLCKLPEMYVSDVALFIFANRAKCSPENRHTTTFKSKNNTLSPIGLDIPVLLELLQKAAVAYLTKFRVIEKDEFGSALAIVTTDYEALYAYKRGEYERCLQLSTDNVHTLLADGCRIIPPVFLFSVFLQLMDDDIVSLTGLIMLADPSCMKDYPSEIAVNQLSLSLYLMTQCQLKTHPSFSLLIRTLCYIKAARQILFEYETMDKLLLKFIEGKIVRCIPFLEK